MRRWLPMLLLGFVVTLRADCPHCDGRGLRLGPICLEFCYRCRGTGSLARPLYDPTAIPSLRQRPAMPPVPILAPAQFPHLQPR